MLVSITWLEYAVIISIALALYYIVIAAIYYKNEISNLSFKKEQQQQNNLSTGNDQASKRAESLDTFFQNQIKDNENHEFENSFNHHEDFEEKADYNRLIDEANFTTSPLQEVQCELFTSHQKYAPSIQETDDTFQQVQELTAGLKEAIATAVDKNCIKEEFIRSLQLVLKKYHFLKGSPFLVSINNLIASECEKYGYIQLSAEDRVMLWNE